MYAIPTPGRAVPIPGTRRLLPSTGQNVGPLTQYWLRRLRDGDISVHPTAPASTTKSIPDTAPVDDFVFHVPTPEPAQFNAQALVTAPAPIFVPAPSTAGDAGGATS